MKIFLLLQLFYYPVLSKFIFFTNEFTICNDTVSVNCDISSLIYSNISDIHVNWSLNNHNINHKHTIHNITTLLFNFSKDINGNYTCEASGKFNKIIHTTYVSYTVKWFNHEERCVIISLLIIYIVIVWGQLIILIFKHRNISNYIYIYAISIWSTLIMLVGQYMISFVTELMYVYIQGIVLIQFSMLSFLFLQKYIYEQFEYRYMFIIFIIIKVILFLVSSIIIVLSFNGCYKSIYGYLFMYKLLFIDILSLSCLAISVITPLRKNINYKQLHIIQSDSFPFLLKSDYEENCI